MFSKHTLCLGKFYLTSITLGRIHKSTKADRHDMLVFSLALCYTHTRTRISTTKQAFFMLESGALSVPKNAKSSELIISKSPTYLNVVFEHHACVKTLGGMWDPKRKQWYVPAGVDITYFLPWLS